MEQNSQYLCLCYTSHLTNSSYTFTWSSLYCCQDNIFPTLPFCICSWEGTSLLQSSVHVLQGGYCCQCSTTVALPFLLQKLYKMHGICKYVQHFEYDPTVTQHSHTSLDKIEAKLIVSQVTAVPAHSTSVLLHNSAESNYSLLDIFLLQMMHTTHS
jgi:hypothetical protein